MSYKQRNTFKSETSGKFTTGVNPWTGQEVEDMGIDIGDSVQWNDAQLSLTDASTITWNYADGGEAVVTINGNRTLSITNIPSDRVVYGVLVVIQGGSGGFSLSLPSPQYKTTIGTLLTGAGAVSEVSFRWSGSAFSFKIS
jgi:hypothetical protein